METMALKGKARDMNKWREVLLDPNVHFPGESSEYRRARNQLLESERELRRMNQQVAAQRRALPLGGVLQGDYLFESVADGSQDRQVHQAQQGLGQGPAATIRLWPPRRPPTTPSTGRMVLGVR